MLASEIIPFLAKHQHNVARGQAIQCCLDLTGTEEGRDFLISSRELLDVIIGLLDDHAPAMQKMAYGVLTNLAAEKKYADAICDTGNGAFGLALTAMLSASNGASDDACELVCNLSRWTNCANQLYQFMKEKDVKLKDLIAAFCNLKHNDKASLDHMGLCIENLSQISDVRRELMNIEDPLLVQIIPFISFERSVFRRSAAAGIVKNCCFEVEFHDWLLGDSVDLLPRLLLPLAGPEEHDPEIMELLPVDLQYLGSDKKREPTAEIRKCLLEALFKLCATKRCRESMRHQQVPTVVAALHKQERDAAVYDAAENVLSVLVNDEPPEDDLHKLEIPEETQRMLEKMDETSSS